MLCLFVRELSLDLVMVLWDFYASCEGGLQFGFSVMHVYVCAAFMEKFRFELLNMEFPGILFTHFSFRIGGDSLSRQSIYERVFLAFIDFITNTPLKPDARYTIICIPSEWFALWIVHDLAHSSVVHYLPNGNADLVCLRVGQYMNVFEVNIY